MTPGLPPTDPPPSAARHLDTVAGDINRLLFGQGLATTVSWSALLTVRAEMLGLHRGGRISANRSCRLYCTLDGWVAINLARPDDIVAVDALTGYPAGDDPWPAVEQLAATSRTADLVASARLLGLPASCLGPPSPSPAPYAVDHRWPEGPPRPVSALRVVDLSAMWAGPLVAKILGQAGADVLKVESVSRPDGARGTPAFYRWLHPADQRTEVIDFSDPSGLARLRSLIDTADVVIEASRPRALEQLGLDAASVAPRAGRIWLSITGYGRGSPGRDWVAFGDDAAVAGGLVGTDPSGDPVFCGDAIADPVSGLFGARAVLEAAGTGGGTLIDLAMSGCAGALMVAHGSDAFTPGARPGGRPTPRDSRYEAGCPR
ncbi:MAG: CoA transferase [Acidimicrobiales bacterium]